MVSNSSTQFCDVKLLQLNPSKFCTLVLCGEIVTMSWDMFIVWLFQWILFLPYSKVVKSTDCQKPGNLPNVKDCLPHSAVYLLFLSSPTFPARTLILCLILIHGC